MTDYTPDTHTQFDAAAEQAARLREAAEKATPGPWKECKGNGNGCKCGGVWSLTADAPVATTCADHLWEDGTSTLERTIADAAYIAAANPAAVLALLDENARLTAQLATAEERATDARVLEMQADEERRAVVAELEHANRALVMHRQYSANVERELKRLTAQLAAAEQDAARLRGALQGLRDKATGLVSWALGRAFADNAKHWVMRAEEVQQLFRDADAALAAPVDGGAG